MLARAVVVEIKLFRLLLRNTPNSCFNIERYFYDADSNEILTFDGKMFTNLNQE